MSIAEKLARMNDERLARIHACVYKLKIGVMVQCTTLREA